MKFLYKINSGYDGFTPARIPQRLNQGKYLRLGWTRYLDEVNEHDECWVYFYGPHAFAPGVYIKGYINRVNRAENYATLRVRESDTAKPLTDSETGDRIAQVVSVRYRQVFPWPNEWNVVPECGLVACSRRQCGDCETWNGLPTIDPKDLRQVVTQDAEEVAPAYWLEPTRCYVPREGKRLAPWVNQTTYIFSAFKLGEQRYAYPLALGIYKALQRRGQLEFDAIVPIPLSPDKVKAEELHRTKALAAEVGRLLGVRVRELLRLTDPISKRRMVSEGKSIAQFEQRYRQLLEVDDRVKDLEKVLLVDDVITRGSTLSCAISKLLEARQGLRIVATSAGQMIVKAAVDHERGFVQ